jgi:hypothetical protein
MDASAIFELYQQLAPAELFRVLQRQMGRAVHTGIYSARLVIWMMIDQRTAGWGNAGQQCGAVGARSVRSLVEPL